MTNDDKQDALDDLMQIAKRLSSLLTTMLHKEDNEA